MLKNWVRLALIALAIIIPALIGVSAWFFHVSFRNEIAVQSQQQMLAITEASVNGITEFMREIQRDLATASKLPGIQHTARNSILETEEHEQGYHLFRSLSDNDDARINAYYLLDANGIVLDRFPSNIARIGASYAYKPGVAYVLKEHKPYVSPLFQTTSEESGFSVLEPVFDQGEFVGILRAVIYIDKIHESFLQTVKVGRQGYMILLGGDRRIYIHPNQEFMGRSIDSLQREVLDSASVQQIELLKTILTRKAGAENLAFDESSDGPLSMAWTYIPINPSRTGFAEVEIRYDDKLPKKMAESRARVIASELDKAIAKPAALRYTNRLHNVIARLHTKYADMVAVTVYGPGSDVDDTLVSKQSSDMNAVEPGLLQEGTVILRIEFSGGRTGTSFAGEELVKVTVPINTSDDGWYLIAAQPFSEIAGPINENARVTIGLAGVLVLSFGFGGFFLYRTEKRKAILEAETENLRIIQQTSTELTQRNALMNNLFESLTHPLYLIDISTQRVLMANSASGFGELTDESTCYRLTHQTDEPCGQAHHPCPLEEVLRTKKTAVVVHTHFDAQGNARDFEVHGYPVLDDEGKVIQMIEYAIDVTERKQLQAQLHQSQKMETIGVLAGGIAHDFNNILTPILGYADIALMQLPPDSPVRESLEQISSGGDRARNLVRQILTLSRQDNLDIESIDIGEVVQEDLSLLRASLPPNIEFDAYIDPECGFISANSAQISQVVMNLCTNAFHAMKEDGGMLTVRLQPFTVDQDSSPGLAPATEGKYIQLAVKDTGHGIDDDTLEKIFNPFFTTKDLGEGTGLGLSVVHGIVQAFDGEIFVDSVVDQGTAITIFLPEIDRNPDVTPVESKTDTRASGHILFVDDEQDIVHVAEQILSKLGYTLTVMTDSEEALELFKQDPATYDLAILDMMMPRMSGTELASAMLSIQPELQIIMATGLMTESSLNEFDQLGIKAKLSKPYNSKEVADVISSVLS